MTQPAAPLSIPLAALGLTAALIAVVYTLPSQTADWVKAEGGPVETASALLYFIAAMILAPHFRKVWPFIIVLLAFGLREFDLDKAAFTEGLLKSRQYTGDTVAMPERILSALILIAILTAVVLVVKRGTKPLLKGLVHKDGIAWCVALALFLGVTAKTVDGLGRKLEPFGIAISDTLNDGAAIYEETAELGMALALLLAAFAYHRNTAGTL